MDWEPRHGYAALGVIEQDKEEDPGAAFLLPLLLEMTRDTKKNSLRVLRL